MATNVQTRHFGRGQWLALGGLLLAVAACTHKPDSPPATTAPATCPIQLQEVLPAESGITFVHDDGHGGKKYIMETVTAGLALFDYDGDGLIDIYFLSGAALQGTPPRTPPSRDALYRNEGNWKFRDVTEQAGVVELGFGMGVAAADYDNDGDVDLFVNNYGPNVLYRNEGDGTFTDVTQAAGLSDGDTMGAGASFLDIDADGLLDLYVGNYVQFSYDKHVTHSRQGYVEFAGPRDFQPAPDFLYHNNGDGTFTDISEQSGIRTFTGSTMGIVAADYDQDGDSDLFILSDVDRNYLCVNDGKGNFEERALVAGSAFNTYGDSLGSMGVECGDFDNDGWLDFLQTSYQGELPVLFRNLQNGCFEDVTPATNVGDGSLPYVNWGVGMVDFDNDGDRDVYIAQGHLQDEIDKYDDSTSYAVRNTLMMNDGKGKFVNVSQLAGNGMDPVFSSRGCAFDDLDGDGRVDGVVLNSRSPSTVIRNVSEAGNHWLAVRLIGVTTNRDAIGTQVRVTAGGKTQVAEVHSGRSYQSHYGTVLHFGLGAATRAEQIEIRWLGSDIETLADVAADQKLTVVQGSTKQ